MRGHCSARGQIGTGTVWAALAGPAWALHSIVGWEYQVININPQYQVINKFPTKSTISTHGKIYGLDPKIFMYKQCIAYSKTMSFRPPSSRINKINNFFNVFFVERRSVKGQCLQITRVLVEHVFGNVRTSGLKRIKIPLTKNRKIFLHFYNHKLFMFFLKHKTSLRVALQKQFF